jgi:hypothetical protein
VSATETRVAWVDAASDDVGPLGLPVGLDDVVGLGSVPGRSTGGALGDGPTG